MLHLFTLEKVPYGAVEKLYALTEKEAACSLERVGFTTRRRYFEKPSAPAVQSSSHFFVNSDDRPFLKGFFIDNFGIHSKAIIFIQTR